MKKLGFGLMRLPLLDDDSNNVNQEQVNQMVDYFMENGFNYFDTAYTYLNGNSEKAVYEALTSRYPRDSFKLATKLPIFNLESSNQMEDIFNEQLTRCGVDYFDYYLLHNVSSKHQDKFTKIDSFKFIKDKKDEGKIKHMGMSSHDKAEFLDDILTKHPEIEFVQLQINYLDWQDSVIQAKECYNIACKHEKPVIVMEPLKGGALTNLPKDAMEVFKNYDNTQTPASWSLRFILSLDNICMVLSGMTNINDLKDNINAVNNFKQLTQEDYDVINKVVKIISLTKSIDCTSCNYCLDACIKKINIPHYFKLYNSQKLLNQEHSIAMYYRNYTIDHTKPDECIECNDCMEYCPQRLNIPNLLKLVTREFE